MAFNIEKYKEIEGFIRNNNSKAKIVSISKNQENEAVLEAIGAGVRIFGENRVQEAVKKFDNLKEFHKDLELHLTGPLQTNKVRAALRLFDVFHILDRKKLADEFAKNETLIQNKKFFIQINLGMEEAKSGISPKESNDFINYCKHKLKLKIIGLMCIPPQNEEPSKYFKKLNSIAKENNLEELSMGMSGDYNKAIECGATYIRVGTILFGNRKWLV